MEFRVQTIEGLKEAAVNIVENLKFPIVLFDAEMGSGKTTLIKELVKVLGFDDITSSPTFSLVNEYKTQKGKVFHFDLYRIKSLEEALDFGVEEYLDSGEFCFIEWPDLITNLLPEQVHRIKIEVEESGERLIEFEDLKIGE